MRIAASVEGSNVLRNVHLVTCHCHLSTPLLLILKPGIGDSQVEISSDFEGRISPEEDFPMVVDSLKDRCEVNVDLRHIFKGLRIMEDFNFLSLGVGDNLPAYIDSVGLIEDIDSHVVGEVGIPDLLHRSESNSDDMLGFLSCQLSIKRWILLELFS